MLIDMLSFWKELKPIDGIFLAAIAVSIASGFLAFFTWKHNQASSKRSKDTYDISSQTNHEVIELRKQNDSLRVTSDLQLSKIDELRQENTKLNSELQKSTRDIYNNMTGDGNKPIVIISDGGLVDATETVPSHFVPQFVIQNKGKYPLRNVTISITDMLGRDMLRFGVKHTVDGPLIGGGSVSPLEDFQNYYPLFTKSYESIPPNVKHLVHRTTFSPESTGAKFVNYTIEVTWANGYVYYIVTLEYKGKSLKLKEVEGRFNGNKLTDLSGLVFK